MWIGPRPDGEHRRLAPVDGHMGYSGRHVKVVTHVRDLSLLELFALHRAPAQAEGPAG